MNIEKRPWGLYKFNYHFGRPGIWFRHGAYKTPSDAARALIDITKKPKKLRVHVYVILPNVGSERAMLVKDHDNLLKSAR